MNPTKPQNPLISSHFSTLSPNRSKILWHHLEIAAWAAVRYFLSLPAQDSAPFKPFNDCLLSLKGGAKSEGETASETEKRLKNRKNKMAESVKRLIFRHFSNFALYQFRCCDVPLRLRIFPESNTI